MIKNEVCQVFFLPGQQIRKEKAPMKTRQAASTAHQADGRLIEASLWRDHGMEDQQVSDTRGAHVGKVSVRFLSLLIERGIFSRVFPIE